MKPTPSGEFTDSSGEAYDSPHSLIHGPRHSEPVRPIAPAKNTNGRCHTLEAAAEAAIYLPQLLQQYEEDAMAAYGYTMAGATCLRDVIAAVARNMPIELHMSGIMNVNKAR